MCPPMTRHHLTISLWGVMVALAAACGGRNLDAGPQNIVDDDDSPDDDGAGGVGASDAPVGSGGFGGVSDGAGGSGATGAGSPIDCFSCIGSNCPEALDCITDPSCVQGIACAVQDCLSGGSPDLMCLSDCFDGDLEAAYKAIEVITCAFGSCQDECGGFLPFP